MPLFYQGQWATQVLSSEPALLEGMQFGHVEHRISSFNSGFGGPPCEAGFLGYVFIESQLQGEGAGIVTNGASSSGDVRIQPVGPVAFPAEPATTLGDRLEADINVRTVWKENCGSTKKRGL